MINLSITFTEHDGALRFRAEADPAKSTPLENATARLVAMFLEREMNLFFATAQRALSHGVVVAPDPESNSAKDPPQVPPSAEPPAQAEPAPTPPSSLESGVLTPKDAPVDLPPDPPAPPAQPATAQAPADAVPPPELFDQPGD